MAERYRFIMAQMTLKRIGDEVRKRLETAEKRGDIPSREPGDDHYGYVRYDVRISNSKKKGPAVNITINGYDWLIPNVDTDDDAAKRWADTDGAALVALVDRIAGRHYYTYGPSGATALGGETKFGPIIRAWVAGVTHDSSSETERKYCDSCHVEITPNEQKYQMAGPRGLEELCKICHDREMTSY